MRSVAGDEEALVKTRLLSWLEYRAWITRALVAVCTRCDMAALDCGVLTGSQDADDAVTGPIMTPSKWPPSVDRHVA